LIRRSAAWAGANAVQEAMAHVAASFFSMTVLVMAGRLPVTVGLGGIDINV
jgi:3-hydroxy-3-methylglutaryl CoA synthase